MDKEESILFPYIGKMMGVQKGYRKLKSEAVGEKDLIQILTREHQKEGERFDHLADITDNFKVPGDGCNTYKLTYNQLKEFKADLHKHIHLENSILFPATEKLEKEVVKNS